MIFIVFFFYALPFILLGLLVAFVHFCVKSSRPRWLKVALGFCLMGMMVYWYLGAGRELLPEYQTKADQGTYTFLLPDKYTGVFVIRVTEDNSNPKPEKIVVQANGIATIAVPASFLRGWSESSYTAENSEGRKYHFHGYASAGAGQYRHFYFCVDQTGDSITECFFEMGDTALVEQALRDGKKLNELIPHKGRF